MSACYEVEVQWQVRVGLAIWLLAVLFGSKAGVFLTWPSAMVLLGAWVVVPLGLRAAATEGGAGHLVVRFASRAQAPAALALTLSYAFSPGVVAAALAGPWMVLTILLASASLARLVSRGLLPLAELSVDAALGFVALGGAWAAIARLGYRPLDFSALIVELTAVHFHFAGFALPLVAGISARALAPTPRWLSAAILGVVIGVPLVAVGITLSPTIELVAAWLVAVAAAAVAVAQLRARTKLTHARLRMAVLVSSASLIGGMGMAAAYAWYAYLGAPWRMMPWMVALHGTLNGLGFAVLGLWAWASAPTQPTAGIAQGSAPRKGKTG